MLSSNKLKELCTQRRIAAETLGGQLVRGGLKQKEAVAAVKNGEEVPAITTVVEEKEEPMEEFRIGGK